MPLFDGKTLEPIAEPVQADSSAIFSIVLTSDYFTSYASYIKRVRHLQSPVFQCIATHVNSLSYVDALTSELRAIHTIRRLSPFTVLHFFPLLSDTRFSDSILSIYQNKEDQSSLNTQDLQYFNERKVLYERAIIGLPLVGETILVCNGCSAFVIYGSDLFLTGAENLEEEHCPPHLGNNDTLRTQQHCIAIKTNNQHFNEHIKQFDSLIGNQHGHINESSLIQSCSYVHENSGLEFFVLRDGEYRRYTVLSQDELPSVLDATKIYPLTPSNFEYICLVLRYFLKSNDFLTEDSSKELANLVDQIIIKTKSVRRSIDIQLQDCKDINDVRSRISSGGVDFAGGAELHFLFLKFYAFLETNLVQYKTQWLFDSWNRAVHMFFPLRPQDSLLEVIAKENVFTPQVMGISVCISGSLHSYTLYGKVFSVDDTHNSEDSIRNIPIRISPIPDPTGLYLKWYLDDEIRALNPNPSLEVQEGSDAVDVSTPSRRTSASKSKLRSANTKKSEIIIDEKTSEDTIIAKDNETPETITASGNKQTGDKIKPRRAPNGCRTIKGEIVRIRDQTPMEVQPDPMQLTSRIILKDDLDFVEIPGNEASRLDLFLHEPPDNLVSVIEESDYDDMTEFEEMIHSVDQSSGICDVLYPQRKHINSLYTIQDNTITCLWSTKYQYVKPPDTLFYAPFRDDSVNKNGIIMSLVMSVWTFLYRNKSFLQIPFITLDEFCTALDVTDQDGYKRQLRFRQLAAEELEKAECEDIREYFLEKYNLTDKRLQLAPVFPLFNGNLVSSLLYLIMSRLVALLYDGEEEFVQEITYEYISKPRSRRSDNPGSNGSSSAGMNDGSFRDASSVHENASSDESLTEYTEEEEYEYSYYTEGYSETSFSADDIANEPPPKKNNAKKPTNPKPVVARRQAPGKSNQEQSLVHKKSKAVTKDSDKSSVNDDTDYSYSQLYSLSNEGSSIGSGSNTNLSSEQTGTTKTGSQPKVSKRRPNLRKDNAKEKDSHQERDLNTADKRIEQSTTGYYSSTESSYSDDWEVINGAKDTQWHDQALRYLLSRINENDRFNVILRILPIFFKLRIKYHKQLEKIAPTLLRTIISAISSDQLLATVLQECYNPITAYTKAEEQEAQDFIRRIAVPKKIRIEERSTVIIRQQGKKTLRMSKSSSFRTNNAHISFKDGLAEFFIALQELSTYGNFNNHAPAPVSEDPEVAALDKENPIVIDEKSPVTTVGDQDGALDDSRARRTREKDRYLKYMPPIPTILLPVPPNLHMTVCIIASSILHNTYFILFLKNLYEYLHFARAHCSSSEVEPTFTHIRFHQLTVQEKLELLNYFAHQVSETENYFNSKAQEQLYNESLVLLSKEFESSFCSHFSASRRKARQAFLDEKRKKHENEIREAKVACLERAKSVTLKWADFVRSLGVTQSQLTNAGLVFTQLDTTDIDSVDIIIKNKLRVAGFQSTEDVDLLKKLIDVKNGISTYAMGSQHMKSSNMHLVRAINSRLREIDKLYQLKKTITLNRKFNSQYHERLDYQQAKALYILLSAEQDNKAYALKDDAVYTDWYMNRFILLPSEHGFLTVADLNYMVIFSDMFMERNNLPYRFRRFSHRQMLRYVSYLGSTPREKYLSEWVKELDSKLKNYKISTNVQRFLRKIMKPSEGFTNIQQIIGITDETLVDCWMRNYQVIETLEESKIKLENQSGKYTTESILCRMEEIGVPTFATKRPKNQQISGVLRLAPLGMKTFLRNDIDS